MSPHTDPANPNHAPPTTAALKRSALVFGALGDNTRLALVSRLAGAPSLSITQLTEGRAITRQAITKHLGVLKRAGLVRSVRRGRERRFILELQSIDRARRYLDTVSRQWDGALDRLKTFVESRPAHEQAEGAGNAPRPSSPE